MSSRKKGKTFENRIRKYLESIGYKVDVARAAVRFIGPGKFVSSANDILGCADLVAIHPEKLTLFIQASADIGNVSTKRKKMEAVPWNLKAQNVQVWCKDPEMRGWIRADHFCGSTQWTEFRFKIKNGIRPNGEKACR